MLDITCVGDMNVFKSKFDQHTENRALVFFNVHYVLVFLRVCVCVCTCTHVQFNREGVGTGQGLVFL